MHQFLANLLHARNAITVQFPLTMKVFFLQYPLSLIGTSKITLAMKEMDLNVGAFAGLLTPLTVTYGYRADGGYYPPKGAFVYASERKQCILALKWFVISPNASI